MRWCSADAFGATLHLLHVVPDPHAIGWGGNPVFLPELMERNERIARTEIEAAFTAEEQGRFHVELVVTTGVPVSRIIEYAQEQPIDLIIIGTQARSTLERIWIGSVTQWRVGAGCARSFPCSSPAGEGACAVLGWLRWRCYCRRPEACIQLPGGMRCG